MTEFILTLVFTHLTIICVTVYLHRGQAHRGMTFHPVLEHAMRAWLWLTTGMLTKEWVAVHRLHHQKCERPGDPHSPWVHGIWKVLFGGAWLYARATQDTKLIEEYGKGTPSDWIEKNVYSRYPNLGVIITLVALTAAFHGWGIVMWLVMVAWIPFWAAGVVNGLGHWWGYRNTNTRDKSTNIVPWDFIVGGELMHNNHHADPANPKLSRHWWEFDLGWTYIKVFEFLGLVKLAQRHQH